MNKAVSKDLKNLVKAQFRDACKKTLAEIKTAVEAVRGNCLFASEDRSNKKETVLVVLGKQASRAAEWVQSCRGSINDMIGAIRYLGLTPNNIRPRTYKFDTEGEVSAFTNGIDIVGTCDIGGTGAYYVYGKEDIKRWNDRIARVEKAWKDNLISKSDKRRYAEFKAKTDRQLAHTTAWLRQRSWSGKESEAK